MSEKITWGKKGQVVYPNESANDKSITWETFSDIHPRYDAQVRKAHEKRLPYCAHCGKGVEQGGWEVRMASDGPNHFRAILPNTTLEREHARLRSTKYLVGNDCATNVPTTHRTKANLTNYKPGDCVNRT